MLRIRIFFVIFGLANAGLISYGLLALTLPGVLLESFSVNVYRFPADAALAVAYVSALYQLLGFLNLVLGVLGLGLLWRYRLSGQPWLAYFVMVFSILAYLGPVIFDNTVGNIGFFEMIEHILFVAMVLSGMGLSRQIVRAGRGGFQ